MHIYIYIYYGVNVWEFNITYNHYTGLLNGVTGFINGVTGIINGVTNSL